MGTVIRLNARAQQVTEHSVLCEDGLKIDADFVLLAAGVGPNTELADGAGLAVENGIVLDGYLLTEDPAISALGDCAAFPDPRTGNRIRLEKYPGRNRSRPFHRQTFAQRSDRALFRHPWFWSDQADWKLQIAGLAAPDDDSVEVGTSTVYRFDRDVLSAVETINDAKTHMKARKLLAAPRLAPAICWNKAAMIQTLYSTASNVNTGNMRSIVT